MVRPVALRNSAPSRLCYREWGFNFLMLKTPENKPLAALLAPAVRRILLKLDLGVGVKDKLRRALGALRSFTSAFRISIGDIGVGIEAASGAGGNRQPGPQLFQRPLGSFDSK